MSKNAKKRLEEIVSKMCIYSYPNKPGAVIQKQNKEIREELEELKSEDIKDVRVKGYIL